MIPNLFELGLLNSVVVYLAWKKIGVTHVHSVIATVHLFTSAIVSGNSQVTHFFCGGHWQIGRKSNETTNSMVFGSPLFGVHSRVDQQRGQLE